MNVSLYAEFNENLYEKIEGYNHYNICKRVGRITALLVISLFHNPFNDYEDNSLDMFPLSACWSMTSGLNSALLRGAFHSSAGQPSETELPTGVWLLAL